MTTNKTTALIAGVIYGSPLHGMPLNDCETVALAITEALAAFEQPDIDKCPACGGEADNGSDREYPPNPYLCTKCEQPAVRELSVEEVAEELYRHFAVVGEFANEHSIARCLAKLGTIRVVDDKC